MSCTGEIRCIHLSIVLVGSIRSGPVCHDNAHWFDVIDGEIALVCRCGKKRRQVME